jgi:hypothetical protein
MATWAELQDQARRSYALDQDDEAEFALTLERRVEGGVRAQRVLVRRYESWGRVMVEIRSAFGEVGDYHALSLLEDNLTLPLGAVAAHGRYLVLVHKACLEDHSVEGVVFLLTQIGVLADVLEGRRGGDRF